jgi:phosphate starvation-inducible PhoH-like protein
MIEKCLIIETDKPLHFFGAKHKNFALIQQLLPHVKLIARGNEIKIQGDMIEVEPAEKKLLMLIQFFNDRSEISEQHIISILTNSSETQKMDSFSDLIITHNSDGKPIKALTPNQKKLVELSEQNDMVFVTGPAGSGKTYTAIALAVRALKNRTIKRIVLSRPAVEAGENLGYLPGNLKEKLDPYLQPLYDALLDLLPKKKLVEYIEDGIIEIAPLAYMRGRTLDNAFVILDEAQNTTSLQLKMFLTRMGKNAKFIITGDITQIDLVRNNQSGLVVAIQILNNIDGIGIIEFNELDIVRHSLVKNIVKAYEKLTVNS